MDLGALAGFGVRAIDPAVAGTTAVSGVLLESRLDEIADALAGDGLIVLDGVLPPPLVDGLRCRVRGLADDRAMRPAGIGRGEEHQRAESVRTDEILWLTQENAVEAAYLDVMDTVRSGLNQRLFLGLFDYECHFAVYAEGAYYRRHLDAFRGQRNRVVTTVFYLNEDWLGADGGDLLIYDVDAAELAAPRQVVAPLGGRLVVFLSHRFPHEVLPARRRRYSIAGWFRLNDSDSRRVDPAR